MNNCPKTLYIVLLSMVCVTGFTYGEKPPADHQNVAMDAYNLRMQGKADQAATLLEQAVSNNPNNAAAHYELARIRLLMALSGKGEISDAQDPADKAVKLDPENVSYAFYAGHVGYFQTYLALMTGGQPKEHLAKATGAFESALTLKPDYHQARLCLIELYSQIPEDSGGDKSKSERHAKQLEAMDEVFGAKARSMLLAEEVDKVDYWRKIRKTHQGNAEVLEELGKAYLRADKVDQAVSCFEKAIKINPEKSFLFLDLSIYHTFRAMRARGDKELLGTCVSAGDVAVGKYIESKPVQPMLAYALGVRAKYKFFSGDKEQGKSLLEQAKALDPYFSKATGAPFPCLFIRPGEISKNHRYLLRPF